ncbi:cytohesin-3 isoform X2 [Lutra lutra]|uniref:cytohesin-3 isoform X2 n=1 Tax=Lutra lutra TaxID=9657 RepID=UPI001FD15A54|nr:cytohesin-3 isoform X2 [Lutra lutra]
MLRCHMYGCERASRRAGIPGSCHKASGDGAIQTLGPPASQVTAQAASVPSLHTAVAIQRVGFQQAGPLSTAAGLDTVLPTGSLPGVLTLAWPLGTAGWRRAPRAKKAVNLLEAEARDVLAWPGLAPGPSLAQGRHRPAHGSAWPGAYNTSVGDDVCFAHALKQRRSPCDLASSCFIVNLVSGQVVLPEGLGALREHRSVLLLRDHQEVPYSCCALRVGGRVKTWKRRWFILTDNCLYYFEYTTDKEPRGIIPLENLSIREVEDPRKPNCFELYNPSHKGQVIKACKTEADGRVVEGNHVVYRISAPSPEEKEEWMKSIRASISRDPFYDMLATRKRRIANKK